MQLSGNDIEQLADMAEELTVILNGRSTVLNITDVQFESARLMLKSVIR